jgi:hypothetical protein
MGKLYSMDLRKRIPARPIECGTGRPKMSERGITTEGLFTFPKQANVVA